MLFFIKDWTGYDVKTAGIIETNDLPTIEEIRKLIPSADKLRKPIGTRAYEVFRVFNTDDVLVATVEFWK